MDKTERNTDILWFIGIAMSGYVIFGVWAVISVLWGSLYTM